MTACLSMAWLGACVPAGANKLGAVDEVCFVDEDCRFGLVCEANRCAEAERNFENNSDNGFDPNNSANNSVDFNNGFGPNNSNNNVSGNNQDELTREGVCLRLCALVVDCGVLDLETCSEFCAETLVSYPNALLDEVLACALGTSCEEVGSIPTCAPGPEEADFARRNLCDIMAFEVLPECANLGRDVSTRFARLCGVIANFYDEETFDGLNGCLRVDTCVDRVACLEEWTQTPVASW